MCTTWGRECQLPLSTAGAPTTENDLGTRSTAGSLFSVSPENTCNSLSLGTWGLRCEKAECLWGPCPIQARSFWLGSCHSEQFLLLSMTVGSLSARLVTVHV